MRPDDEQQSRLLRLWSFDAEFAHPVVESGAVEAQSSGCSGRTTNHPSCLTEDLQDVVAFDCLESCWTLKLIKQAAICRFLQLYQRNFQHRTARKNHRSLNQILQLANI